MPETREIKIPILKLTQKIGEFYIGVIRAEDIIDITYVDRREMQEKTGGYIGIQRELNEARKKEIAKYVSTTDATFPTSIVLAIDGNCVEFSADQKELTLKPYDDLDDPNNSIPFDKIAKVLDGQHRIEGLTAAGENLFTNCENGKFDLNVTIFIDMEVADQAMVFSTVNLHQSKVNKSLVYDLFELATSRSPQKTAHDVVVLLNETNNSPFKERIKRLGKATPGRTAESLNQATFVQLLLKYISKDPIQDRSDILSKKKLPDATEREIETFIFRNLFLHEKDADIAKIVWSYFSAIAEKWPEAWNRNRTNEQGYILHKTNGFRAFMRFLREVYLEIIKENGLQIGDLVTKTQFRSKLERIPLRDEDFTILEFNPGSGGEARLYRILSGQETFVSIRQANTDQTD